MAIYLFCLCHEPAVLPASSDENKLGMASLHRHAGLTALIGSVDAAELTGPDAEARLKDPAWLLPRIEQHERMVEVMMAQRAVVPAPFGTLFSSMAALERTMRQHAAAVSAFLVRTERMAEWAVKAWLDRERALSALVAANPESQALPSAPGRRYVVERQLRLAAEQALGGWARDACSEVRAVLDGLAGELVGRPLRAAEADGETLIGNWALLLHRDQRQALAGLIDETNRRHADAGLRLQHSGPWPPYSFTASLTSAP